MKLNNKKGFTLVELVIVIAVIAILAAVLIPTFSNVIASANENAAMQNARNALTDYLSGNSDRVGKDYIIQSGKYYFLALDGSFNSASVKDDVSPRVIKISDVTYTLTIETNAEKESVNGATIYTNVSAGAVSNNNNNKTATVTAKVAETNPTPAP